MSEKKSKELRRLQTENRLLRVLLSRLQKTQHTIDDDIEMRKEVARILRSEP